MSADRLHLWARRYALLVGAMDLATGLGLVLVPAITLRAMGAEVPPAVALPLLRFAGVFVGAVGASYLWALATGGAARLRSALGLTLLFRAGAGTYAAVAVAVGAFDGAWLLVAATDLGCVAVQAWFLAKGVGRDA